MTFRLTRLVQKATQAGDFLMLNVRFPKSDRRERVGSSRSSIEEAVVDRPNA